MGNLYAESALSPTNLQNTYEKKLGMTDSSYTEAVDKGTYTNFVKDSAGYGLAQWTYWSRKESLLNFATERGSSIGDLEMQLEFLWKELGSYSTVLKTLKSASSVREASDVVLTKYEKPANQSDSVKMVRAGYGQTYYDKYASASVEQPSGNEGETMSYDPKKVIQVALNEVGYLEKKNAGNLDDKTANAGSNNYTKYARDLDAIGFYNGKKQGFAWCDCFVDWCFVEAYGLEAALALTCQPFGKDNCGAGCKYSRQYYKNKKQLFDTPMPGDQVFFYPSDGIGGSAIQHTGLVYAVDEAYIYTVEGNTSGANGVVANGGGVCKKKYKRTYARLAGFGRPDWNMNGSVSSGSTSVGTPSTTSRVTVKKGSKNATVKELQVALIHLGYSLPKYGADGDCGTETVNAIKAFQKDHDLEVDGICGAMTWAAIDMALVALDTDTPETSEPKKEEETTTAGGFQAGTQIVSIIGNSVHARVGDSTKYSSIGYVAKGDVYEYVATSPTGWLAIRMGNRIAWVSNKYAKVGVA